MRMIFTSQPDRSEGKVRCPICGAAFIQIPGEIEAITSLSPPSITAAQGDRIVELLEAMSGKLSRILASG